MAWRLAGGFIMASHPLMRAAIGVALSLVSLATSRGEATFDNAVFYGAGSSPVAVGVGDLDGDHDNDLAVVTSAGDLQVLFNNGNGTFQNAVPYLDLWASYTNDVEIADLDRDGDNDLVVAFFMVQGAVSVLLNNGDGTFASPANYDSCYSTQGITVADFNGDLHRDVAGMSNCFKASILLNDGSAILVKKGDYGVGYVPGGIDSADLDGDRDLDIVYSNGTNDLTVLFNDGMGGFDDFTSLDEHDQPQWIVLADYDGDGDNDIAVANVYTNDIGIFANDGSGNFTGPTKYDAGTSATGLAGGDLDNDGDVDLVAANNGSDNATFRWNAGNATFPTQTTKSAGDGPQDAAVGDLNGDARLDVVVVSANSNNVAVFINRLNASPDTDDDGVTNASDCAPTNASAWAMPSDVGDLLLSDAVTTKVSWSAPTKSGSRTPRYDVLRSTDSANFSGAACVESDGTNTVAFDATIPSSLAFYLVRTENACGGTLGTRSDGTARTGASCP